MSVVVYADGYHGAAVAVGNLEQWEQQVVDNLGLERVSDGGGTSSSEMKAGGNLSDLANATRIRYRRPRGRLRGHVRGSQLDEVANVLAWLDQGNVIPREFPDFDLERIPDFRETAKKILAALGSEAVPRLLQDLVTPPNPPPGGSDMEVAPTFQRDVIDTLGRMETVEPLETIAPADVERAIKTILDSGLPKAKQSPAIRTLVSALPTPELNRLRVSNAMVRQACREVLLDRCLNGEEDALEKSDLVPALKKLIVEQPKRFIEFRRDAPWAAAQCAEALAKTPSANLRRLFRKDGNPDTLALLLEKPDAFNEMGPDDLNNPKIRDAMIAAAEQGAVTPSVAAMLLECRRLSVDDLKGLITSGKTWEKLGAFHLLLRKLPQTETSATWLLERFLRLPANAQSAMRGRMGQRLEQASTASLVGALPFDQAGLHEKIVETLVERSRSTDSREELRRQQETLVQAFAKNRPGNHELIPLLVNLKTKTTLTALVDALTDADATVWQECRNELCKVHPGGMSYGPPNSADQTARAGAQQKWRTWLAGYQEPP